MEWNGIDFESGVGLDKDIETELDEKLAAGLTGFNNIN